MTLVALRFQPIETIPGNVWEAVLRGGEMDSGFKRRPYGIAEAWRDEEGRWWVGRGCEIEIIAPAEWSLAPEPFSP